MLARGVLRSKKVKMERNFQAFGNKAQNCLQRMLPDMKYKQKLPCHITTTTFKMPRLLFYIHTHLEDSFTGYIKTSYLGVSIHREGESIWEVAGIQTLLPF